MPGTYISPAETGFYYVSSRYYDAEIGRFLNADSLINQSSVIGNNMFAYCLNNPINMADNTGNLPFFVVTAAIGAVAGAVIKGVKATKSGKSVWKEALKGAAIGGLAGAGLGALASATLAGSVAATTTKVAIGVGKLATAVTTGGLGAGVTYIANNISQVINSGGGQVASQTGKNVYYQVTSSEAARTIADARNLIPSPIEGSVCVLNFQPTLTQARQLGAQSVETVIRFSTNCTTFVPDLTVPYSGAYRNLINGAIQIFDVVEVGFK